MMRTWKRYRGGIRRVWMVRAGIVLLGGTLLAAMLGGLFGGGHNPNHGIDREKARAAARRVHTPPEPGAKRIPGFGG